MVASWSEIKIRLNLVVGCFAPSTSKSIGFRAMRSRSDLDLVQFNVTLLQNVPWHVFLQLFETNGRPDLQRLQQFQQCRSSLSHSNANPRDICSAIGPKTWTLHERVGRVAFSAIIWMLPSCFPRIYLSIVLIKSSSRFPSAQVFFSGSDPKCSLGNKSIFFTNWSCLECQSFQPFPSVFKVQRLQKKTAGVDDTVSTGLRAAFTASGSPRILTSNTQRFLYQAKDGCLIGILIMIYYYNPHITG